MIAFNVKNSLICRAIRNNNIPSIIIRLKINDSFNIKYSLICEAIRNNNIPTIIIRLKINDIQCEIFFDL